MKREFVISYCNGISGKGPIKQVAGPSLRAAAMRLPEGSIPLEWWVEYLRYSQEYRKHIPVKAGKPRPWRPRRRQR